MLKTLCKESYSEALQRQLRVFNGLQGLGETKRTMRSGPERSIVDTVVTSDGVKACGRLSYCSGQGPGVIVDCIARCYACVL